MLKFSRNSFAYVLIFVALVAIFFTFYSGNVNSTEIPITRVISEAQKGTLDKIEISTNGRLKIINNKGEIFTSRTQESGDFMLLLESSGVGLGTSGMEIEYKGSSGFSNLFAVLLNFLPIIFFGAVLLFMMRQAQGSAGQTLNFGRSKARMLMSSESTVSFDDVAGVEEAKIELEEVVDFLKHAERFLNLGAKIPKGVLLVGPPGTGKTLLARAVAGEAKVPFYSISGSEFVEMFVGVGASRVRDLFDQAKRNSPCIVFVDEIDAVGRHRGAGLGGGHDEREQTLNQILVEMDGFDTNVNVIVMAATNRPDILDPALLRPGRFDRRVVLDNPDIKGRSQILKVHAKGKPIAEAVNLDNIARDTHGFSGADLANLINESAILAARRNSMQIDQDDLLESIDRVTMGPERKSRVISDKEKELTAYHEAGHALVGHLLPHSDPITKITIVARGSAGGYTKAVPDEDRHLWTKNQFEDRLAMSMGGRVAEETVFGEITTGASNDLEQATDLARVMVTKYGMSEKLGPRTFGKRDELVFLGKEISEQRDYSDKIAEDIDDEVRNLIKTAYIKAKKTIEANSEKLRVVAEYLIKNETINGDKFHKLIAEN